MVALFSGEQPFALTTSFDLPTFRLPTLDFSTFDFSKTGMSVLLFINLPKVWNLRKVKAINRLLVDRIPDKFYARFRQAQSSQKFSG
jgi:hypothetical protein